MRFISNAFMLNVTNQCCTFQLPAKEGFVTKVLFMSLAQWRCLKIILKLGNHIYLENFVIVLIKLENLKSIPWKVLLFNTDLKRKVNIKDEIFPCKWVNKPKIEPEVQGFLIKHSKTVAASVVPSVHLGYFDACKLRQSRLLI